MGRRHAQGSGKVSVVTLSRMQKNKRDNIFVKSEDEIAIFIIK